VDEVKYPEALLHSIPGYVFREVVRYFRDNATPDISGTNTHKILIIPEGDYPLIYSCAMPYHRLDTKDGTTGQYTWPSQKTEIDTMSRLFPGSAAVFTVENAKDVLITGTSNPQAYDYWGVESAAQHGNVLLYHSWYQALENGDVRSIYRAPGAGN
jgi:hypothetical protein